MEEKEKQQEQEKQQEKQKDDTTIDTLLAKLDELQKNTVSKDEYKKVIEENKKLIEAITTNRPNKEEGHEKTREDKVKECVERYNSLGTKDFYEQFDILVSNYDTMKELGMDTSIVDEDTVEALRKIFEDSKGDHRLFESLLDTKVIRK